VKKIAMRKPIQTACALAVSCAFQFSACLARGEVHADKTVSGVLEKRDIFYTHDQIPNRSLDLFLPRDAVKPLPLVILIHGGGWSGGDKAHFDYLAKVLAEKGFAAASINYRLSKEAVWPAAAFDCKAAVRWFRAHSKEYSIDPNKIAVGGHSAGAHLSAFLAASNGVKKFDRGDNLDQSSDVQAELWYSGVANLVTRATTRGYEVVQNPHSDESSLLGRPILENRALAMDASPVSWVSARSAPFYFVAGTADKLVPPQQVDEMVQALNKFGIYSEVHMISGAGHAAPEFWDVEHLNMMLTFLKRALKLKFSTA
jgi:acetyl esterase/lipase